MPATVTVGLEPAVAAIAGNEERQNPTIMISVGGSAPFPVIFDTGSSGLRVFADAFTTFGGVPSPGSTPTQYGYGGANGKTYFGVVSTADVKFTNVASGGPVDFGPTVYQYVTSVCPKPETTCDTSLEQKLESEGQYGTLGVRPVERNDTSGLVYTPMNYLPGNLGHGFIVSLGNGTAEQLILGLTTKNSTGFNKITVGSTLEPDGRYVFPNEATFPFCFSLTSKDGTTTYSSPCGTQDYLSDTGASTSLQFPGSPTGSESLVDAAGNLVTGTKLKASINGTTWWSITAGSCANYDQLGVTFNASPSNENMGISPFLSEDVLYNFVDGVFGYRPTGLGKPPFCTGPQG